VTDPAGRDDLVFWLAYLHPAWMLLSIGLAVLVLRAGLRMRTARLRRTRRDPGLLKLHLRLARPTVLLLVAGFAGGLVSAVFLRGFEAFGTVHSLVSSLALALFMATGWVGFRLERGRFPRDARPRAADTHGWLGLASLLAAAAAFGTGFVLLP